MIAAEFRMAAPAGGNLSVVNHFGTLYAYAIGQDGALWDSWQTSPGGAWTDWYRGGEHVTSVVDGHDGYSRSVSFETVQRG